MEARGGRVTPSRFQLPLPFDRVILERAVEGDAVEMDVVFVGAGPAGLAGAIELARLAREEAGRGGMVGGIDIAVLEKASGLGDHSVSGAVLDPRPLRELFPDLPESEFPFRKKVERESAYFLTSDSAWRVPVPPTMRNHGNWTVSICEVVRWMGARAEALGVHVFPGFPVESLLVHEDTVRGVRSSDSGRMRDGTPGATYTTGMDVSAKVTVLAEGARGLLTQGWAEWQRVGSRSPPTYALGVKELWGVKGAPEGVIHTMGWPVRRDTFGGSWIYPMGEDLVSLGLVVGLDAPHADLDVHARLQAFKTHPLVARIIEGGELIEWGAKIIPEGGYHSLLERRHGDGICVIGDAAGYVDVPSLKGIHYAVQSGMLAGRAIFEALKMGSTSGEALRAYTESVDRSFILADLRRSRNMRSSFRAGLLPGALKAGVMTLTGGRFPGGSSVKVEDADVEKTVYRQTEREEPDGRRIFSKVDAVYRSGNQTRDDIPNHLLAAEVPPEVARFYADLCPAGVYGVEDGALSIHPANCIDCKATDVLGPRWTPREGGSGPSYRRM